MFMSIVKARRVVLQMVSYVVITRNGGVSLSFKQIRHGVMQFIWMGFVALRCEYGIIKGLKLCIPWCEVLLQKILDNEDSKARKTFQRLTANHENITSVENNHIW